MSPLVERDLDDLIAILQHRLRPLRGKLEFTTKEFLAQAVLLSKLLPDGNHALNLCGNRYLFMLAFCAVILRGQSNLLPPNRNVATQKALLSRYNGSYVIYDAGAVEDGQCSDFELYEDAERINIADLDLSNAPFVFDVPKVKDEQLCAISFTSGSTGDSKPNLKYWDTLRESSLINVRHMLPERVSTHALLATVPAQHMWGLETSILNPMFSNTALSDTKLLFPKDIQSELESLPEPRVLVSTPVHLRALLGSGLSFPRVDTILCATAPLDIQLAKDVEALFGGELCEVFGCSEVGSMAFRRTSKESDWHLFKGINLKSNKAGTLASAKHLRQQIQLQDVVELSKSGSRFRLCGRQTDMVEIAGKRGSLQEINRVLLSVKGVADGVVFLPEADSRRIPRPVALVVASSNCDKKTIVKAFRSALDDAFVPRPIHLVQSLPREENGKLPKKNVEELFLSLSKS